jgi:putative ABC transport system permease protein
MPILSTIKSAVRTLFRGEKLDRELDEELQSYLDLLIEEKMRAGMDPTQARKQALIELGGAEQVKATVRETRHGAALDMLLHDIRFSLRMLKRSPGFAAVFVVTLAIGIGANTALFSTIKALLLSQLPYQDADRLVASVKTYDGQNAGPVSRLDFFDYRRLCRSFDGFCALSYDARFTMTGSGRAEAVGGLYVTWDLFPTLGVSPVRGRGFTESEEALAGAQLALISHDLWQRRFGGSEDAVGRPIHLDGSTYEVVGVMPPGFRFLRDADLWILIDRSCPIDPQRDSHSMIAVGRLKDGVSLEQAQIDVNAVAAVLEQEYPDTNTEKGLRLFDLREYMVAHVRPSLNLLLATTGLLLLIACINVAGLQLARGQRRLSEMAMRSALGANRRRLVRQLLTESVILTLVAGLAGITVAYVFHNLLLRLLPPGDPGVPVPTIDAGVLLFALAISVATGLIVGAVPAVRGTSFNIWQKLGSATRTTEGKSGTRLRSGMVVVQVAMSVVLLVGCGLLVRSMLNLASVQLGFDTENVICGTYGFQADDQSTARERVDRVVTVIESVKSLPGVTNAAAITKMPIASTGTDWPIWHATEPRPEPKDSDLALARAVTPGYFSTIGIPLLRGRDFAESDAEGTAPVVIISTAVAQTLFPDRDPLGQMVMLGWFDFAFEVVGVVGNANINGVRSDYDEAMYLPSTQFGPTYQWLVVRSEGDPALVAEPVRKLVEGMDRNAVLGDLVTMRSLVDEDLSGFRVVSLALGLLSVVALLLTAVGLYGVLAYHVGQRTNEIGIRFALGASPTEVIGLIMKKGLVMVGIGLVLGLLGASLSSRMIQSLLFEIKPLDPIAYLSGAFFFAAVSAVACLVPAWRAARVNPVTALCGE